jgi:hypothetical protein
MISYSAIPIFSPNQNVLSMVESLKPAAFTLSPLLPNTLRILVLVEASNKSSKLSFRVSPFGVVFYSHPWQYREQRE